MEEGKENKRKISRYQPREGQLPETCNMTNAKEKWKERTGNGKEKEREAKEGAQTRVTQTATCCCARTQPMDERGLV